MGGWRVGGIEKGRKGEKTEEEGEEMGEREGKGREG